MNIKYYCIITTICLFFLSCVSTDGINKDEWIKIAVNNEYLKEIHIVQEIIDHNLKMQILDPSEKFLIFDEDMPINMVSSIDINKYIYTFYDAKYYDDEKVYKIYFVNSNGRTKEYIIGIGLEAYYSYNRMNKTVKIDGYHVYSIFPTYKTSYYFNKVYRNDILPYGFIMASISYWKILSEKPLLSTINQVIIGKRYLADKFLRIEYKISDTIYNAKMNNYEFVLKTNDGKTVFHQYQVLNPNKVFSHGISREADEPEGRTYAEIEYIGNDIFITQAGFMRQMPVYKFIGVYTPPSIPTPKFLYDFSLHPREVRQIDLHFSDYNNVPNRGIQKIFSTYGSIKLSS